LYRISELERVDREHLWVFSILPEPPDTASVLKVPALHISKKGLPRIRPYDLPDPVSSLCPNAENN